MIATSTETAVVRPRKSGVLLHPTSLPGPYGSGDFGDEAHHFIEWLAACGQKLWQILPLTPVGPEFSPYTSTSAHAGNPLLISPQRLHDAGLIGRERLDRLASELNVQAVDPHRVDVQHVLPRRMAVLREAFETFRHDADHNTRQAFDHFCASHVDWLDEFTLFMTLRDVHHHAAWNQWPEPLARRDPDTLARARDEHRDECTFWAFTQWIFDEQWQAVRQHANQCGIALIGDIPIYCAYNSSDVWAHPDLFQLDELGRPRNVAGVPPDYFSADGQKWGNPLYNWDTHRAEDFRWWCSRVRLACRQTDLVRIDHFRGLAGYWEVPVDAPTARTGRWMPGPGQALFDAIARDLGDIPLIAEDLGIITDDVMALRRAIDVPGMAVLQFAFGDDAENLYLPHNIERDTVMYTGTHDNDTTRGWFEGAGDDERKRVQVYLQADGSDIQWDFIRVAWSSIARYAICPMQDVLGLGSEARMNMPGQGDRQWRWRFDWSQLQDWQRDRLRALTEATGR